MQDLFGSPIEKSENTKHNINDFKEISDENIDTNEQIKYEIKDLRYYDTIINNLLTLYKNNKLHHSYIFSGQYGIGKATLAYNLAAKLILSNSQSHYDSSLNLLQNCSHPDIHVLSSQDNTEIKVDQIRELINNISLTSTFGIKVIIIDNINQMNVNSSNAILKILEEPPANTYFFLIDHKFSAILPTIKSRSNIINIQTQSLEQFQNIVSTLDNIAINQNETLDYYNYSGGSIGVYKIIHDHQLFDLCKKITTGNANLSELHSQMQKLAINQNIQLLIFQNLYTIILKNNTNNCTEKFINNINKFMHFMKNINIHEIPIKNIFTN